ncbi:hypothetical protein DSLASN_15470 [Desulfoluna limicola]|uniref:DUF2383 domain-containing protein n=1 Tax=Desulfoluna limicola TaxID=2810562 RepID=A0ABN6F3V0_9BACT|nr:hypothetical protein [Desulfoluna limicola]BCS95915.1 hypothetical protein DSLASN_15470 [Desulfoluna limicola]
MLLNISKEEYRLLVEMVQVADYVMHSHELEESDATADYREFRKKIFSHHKKMGLEKLFTFSEKHNDYIETEESLTDSRHMAILDNFVENEFWAQLSQRLAMRDLFEEEEDEEAIKQMGSEVLMEKLGEMSVKYNEEFEAHGLERIGIKE